MSLKWQSLQNSCILLSPLLTIKGFVQASLLPLASQDDFLHPPKMLYICKYFFFLYKVCVSLCHGGDTQQGKRVWASWENLHEEICINLDVAIKAYGVNMCQSLSRVIIFFLSFSRALPPLLLSLPGCTFPFAACPVLRD